MTPRQRPRPTVSVIIKDRFYDASGAEIAAWRHACLVSEIDDRLRLIAAPPEAKFDAWEAHGTRLGVW